jgi:hypothetical protein
LGIRLVGMGRANQIHRDVGINQDHGWPEWYPCSISASMVWMSTAGPE